MTYEEAVALKTFDHYCTCGGFAAGSLNSRDPNDPHMVWCPQRPQWMEWREALDRGTGHVDAATVPTTLPESK